MYKDWDKDMGPVFEVLIIWCLMYTVPMYIYIIIFPANKSVLLFYRLKCFHPESYVEILKPK